MGLDANTWGQIIIAAISVVGLGINALLTHRVHVQFNSRFDQLLIAAEERGKTLERAASDLRDVAKAKLEADERREIRQDNKTTGL